MSSLLEGMAVRRWLTGKNDAVPLISICNGCFCQVY
jgi:hypothetical protein